MNYAEARCKIRDGDFVAIRSTHGGLAALTRFFTSSPFTHTGVAIWLLNPQTGDKGLYLAEMDGAKAVLTPLSQYAEKDMDVFECPVGREETCLALLALLREKIAYDYMDLLRIALWKTLRIGLPKEDRNGLVCSAMSALIYYNAGWRVEMPSIPAPVDVVQAIKVPPFLVVRND